MPDNDCYINGLWSAATGPLFESHNPATGDLLWKGRAAQQQEIDAAVAAAQRAFDPWRLLPLAERIKHLTTFGAWLSERKEFMATTISQESGKPLWDALNEVNSMIGKIDISIAAYNDRCAEKENTTGSSTQHTRFHPHGVLAVFGPFNFPGHLPNGHIVPALLAGNTIVFKPSEKTPLTALEVVKGWHAAGLPKGVLNMIQGGRETGSLLAHHPDLNGILFTGSWNTGKALSEILAPTPGKILALEMGGNNPLVVWDTADLDAAAYITIQSAYLSAGQRCTCARRLIIADNAAGEAFLQKLVEWIPRITIGPYTDSPEPFMGPVISAEAAQQLLRAQQELIDAGAKVIIAMKQLPQHDTFVSPALIDVTGIKKRVDIELFGPFLQVIRVKDFASALQEANNTAYGLSAGIVSDDEEKYRSFLQNVNAGVINWNAPTTGTSSAAPFGGLGKSGNNRPSAYFAADYCCYPISSMEHPKASLPPRLTPGISDGAPHAS